MTEIVFPKRRRGHQSDAARREYDQQAQTFCDALIQIDSSIDFTVSSRGWCYQLEPHGLLKGDFDKAQKLINECRKSGLLPIDFTAEDSARKFENLECIDDTDPEEEANDAVSYINNAQQHYYPVSFWENQAFFVQMLVEKIDLRSLFGPVCADYAVPIANAKGWSDINSRADLMRRFAEWERRSKQCVLLYCGDFDPGGLIISDTLRSNMEDLAGAVGWSPANLIINRFGLNLDFIEEHRLTWIDNLETASGKRLDKTTHPDHDKPYVQDYIRQFEAKKVEANALVARIGPARDLCRRTILQYIDEDAIEDYREDLARQQERVRIEIRRLIDTGALNVGEPR